MTPVVSNQIPLHIEVFIVKEVKKRGKESVSMKSQLTIIVGILSGTVNERFVRQLQQYGGSFVQPNFKSDRVAWSFRKVIQKTQKSP